MKCDETQAVRDLYLDSELDSQASLEVDKHLQSCPQCAGIFARHQKTDSLLKAALQQGERTPHLWNRIEWMVASNPNQARVPAAPAFVNPPLARVLQAGFDRAPRAWIALAATWVIIVALNSTGRDPDNLMMAGGPVPSRTEVRLALQQQLRWATELAMTSEPVAAPKPKSSAPGPRSERGRQSSNA